MRRTKVSPEDRTRLLSLKFLEESNCRLCNCAECGIELLSAVSRMKYFLTKPKGVEFPPAVAGRAKDRPYCSKCLPNWR